MKKGELAKAAGISDYMMSKLNKDETGTDGDNDPAVARCFTL
jgi:hypothetical protein